MDPEAVRIEGAITLAGLRAIVPVVVIVPPVKPVPAVIEVTPLDAEETQLEPSQTFRVLETVSNQNSPGLLPANPPGTELGATEETSADPAFSKSPALEA
jgi:hypothetical protein